MKTKLLSGLSLAMMGAMSMSASAVETANLPFEHGMIYGFGTTCGVSSQGGLASLSSGTCVVEVPVSLATGRLLKQVTVFYGKEGSGMTPQVSASLGFKDLRSASLNNSFANAALFPWSGTVNVADAAMASVNLMAQSGLAPNYTYPDAFTIESNRAYFVRVSLLGSAEFFGARVTYD